MARCRFLKFSLLSLAIMLLLPAASWADIVYTFIKVTCNPDANTAILQGFYVDNEAGAKKAQTHEKDTYDLTGITEHGEKGQSKRIKACDLGNGQTVSFTAQESREHPRANGLTLFLNNKELPRWFSLANGAWTLEILKFSPGQFSLRECDDQPGNKKPEDICKVWPISVDKIIEPSSKPIETK